MLPGRSISKRPLAQGPLFYPAADGLSDEELVKRFQAGDIAAFDILFQRYNQPLCGYIMHATDRDGGEDIAQSAFEIAYNKLASLKEGECFKAWLYRIATNLIKDQWRRSNLLQWLSWAGGVNEDSINRIAHGEEFEHQVEQKDFIQRVMCTVSCKYRLCTYLDIFEDMRQHEIAELLNMKERTVRRYIAQGKEELRASYHRFVDEWSASGRRDNQ